MSNIRKVDRIIDSKPTIEGAGVHLKRAFGFSEVPLFDPFLLLDDFHSNNPDEYIAGFPWHPHRGIETVTYMINGVVKHGDSIGNMGSIYSGDVQWMTAGSGILHQEMPQRYEGLFQGFQLWVNLPSSHKMMKPRYRGIESEQIPIVSPKQGIKIRLIAGTLDDKRGPVHDLVVNVEYLDVKLAPDIEYEYSTMSGYKIFAYVFEGNGFFEVENENQIGKEHLVLFKNGRKIIIKSGNQGIRFLLVSGKVIGEPVAWRGPIVMNTQQELELAFEEYQKGTFIKNI